jgi:oligoendopeptidase F
MQKGALHFLIPAMIATVVLSLTLTGAAAPQPSTADATGAGEYVWDLSPLFASDAAWEAERQDIAQRLGRIARLRGVMQNMPTFAQVMHQTTRLRQDVANLTNYAFLEALLDVRSPERQARYASAAALEASVLTAVSFVNDDVRRLGPAKVAAFLRANPQLNEYQSRLHTIFVEGPHSPGPAAAVAQAALVDWQSSSGTLWQSMFERGIPWPSLQLDDGAAVKLDRTEYDVLRESPNAATRRAAASEYFRELQTFEDLFGVLLTQRISADLALARFRKFDTGLEAAQFDEGVPASATKTMIEAARDHLSLLRRYVALRMRALSIEHPSYYDLRAALPTTQHVFSVRETLAITRAAAEPLGETYQARMDSVLARPWLHAPPWPQKRDTYGNWGNFIRGKPTFGFIRYQGRLLDSWRLAGLVFSLMVKTNIPADRPIDQREDPAIYGNAILMAGQILHDDYIVAHAETKAERVDYLLADLDHMASDCFDDVRLTEFVTDVEAEIKAGSTPSGSDLSGLYRRLLRVYYGDDLDIDPIFDLGWISEPYLFYGYIDQHFPASVAAATLLVERARANDGQAIRGFDHVRGRIGSDYSYDLLKAAGVDLAANAPYDAAFARMSHLLDLLEANLR